MADEIWDPVVSPHEKKRIRDDELREERLRAEAPYRSQRSQTLAWFNSTHPPPPGPADEYEKNHAQLYGVEERMIHGKHRPGVPTFPQGSERDIAHGRYVESTKRRDRARVAYRKTNQAHIADIENLNSETKEYYEHSTKGLFPTQHAGLSGRALDLGDAAWKNGSLRTAADDDYPFGQHSFPQALDYHESARKAWEEYEQATRNYNRHERYRSSEVDDGQRDCYGRSVSAGTRPHTRSRTHSLPPPGHYSAMLKTPPGEISSTADSSSPPSSAGDAALQHRAETWNNTEQRNIDW